MSEGDPTVAQQTKRSPETGDLSMPVQMVTGRAAGGTCGCRVRPRKHSGQAIGSHTSERISTVECRPAASTGFGAQRGRSRTPGATSRAALISMMRDALKGPFDVVLAEALDRFRQDQDENLRARQIVAFSACSRSNC